LIDHEQGSTTMAQTTQRRERKKRESITDDADLTGEYAYIAGVMDFIVGGNVTEANKWHANVPVQALSCNVARTIHRALGDVLQSPTPTIHDVAPAIRQVAGVTPDDLQEDPAIGLYQRMLKALQKLTSKGAYIVGITNRAHEIHERYARQSGIELCDKLREAMEDRGTGLEELATIRRQVDWVEDIIQRRTRPAHELVAVTMDTVEAKPVPWLWYRRIVANGVNIVTGPVGQSKSLFMIDIVARITRGARWPDSTGTAPEGSVLMLGNEDDLGSIVRPRLEAAGAKLNRVTYVQGVRSARADDGEPRPVFLEKDMALLTERLDAMHDCKMIVFDPLNDFLEADENSSGEVRQALTPLMKMAAERGIAVVAVCHQNKKSESNLSVIQRVQGSAAFGQAARVVLAMFNDPDDDTADDSRRRLMIVAKSNYGGRNTGKAYRLKQREGDAEPHIDWLAGDVTVDANDLGRKPSGGREHEERIGDALDTLRGLLANGPRAGAEIEAELKAANLGRRQIDKACSKLEVVKEQVTDDQGKRFWQWSLLAPSVGRVESFPEFGGNWSAGFGD
jgi:putative DNA primase/helicase